MKFSTSGITLASVALVAVVGGVAGGALVGTGGSPEQSNREVELRSTTNDGELTDPAPAPSPSAITVPVLEPVAEAPASEPAPAPEPAPSGTTVDPVAENTQQAKEAAERAERAADRAEDAADRAEAPEPTPAPVTTPVATPVPTPQPECKDGDTQQFTDNRTQREPGWTPGTRTCINGKWVRTAEPKPPVATAPVAAPAPPSQ